VQNTTDEVLGITVCEHCQKRFRILKKHAKMVGKIVQCTKCHRSFTIAIQSPSPIEQAAIQVQTAASSDASESTSAVEQKNPKKRRKQEEIRSAYFDQIKTAFSALFKQLKAITDQESSSEEQVRIWCINVLKMALGYEDADIDTEMSALHQRIDIAIVHEGHVLMVIECKNIRSKLPSNVRDQAVAYAVNKSADWAAVTNGQVWKLYHVTPVKGKDPSVVEVFDIALLDEDGLSDDDVKCFYLLTKRALIRGDSKKEFHLQQSLHLKRLISAFMNPQTIKVLRKLLSKGYRQETGQIVKLNEDIIHERLQEVLLPKEL
jgi:predicted Zn finger-like uncharacterized protein